MNCEQITENLRILQKIGAELPSYFSFENLNESLKTKNDFSSFAKENLKEVFDPYKVELRDELARRNGYDFVSEFTEGRAWAVKNNQADEPKVFLIDETGREFFADDVSSIDIDHTVFRNGKAWVRVQLNESGKNAHRLIDKSGRRIALYGAENEFYFDSYAETGTILGRTPNGVYFYFDEDGNVMFASGWASDFEYATPFSDGLAWVRRAGTLKLIDLTGKVIKEYDKDNDPYEILELDPEPFRDGLSRVTYGNYMTGFFDTSGVEVFTLSAQEVHDFSDGKCLVQKGSSEYFFVDKKGGKDSRTYAYAGDYHEGFASVTSTRPVGFGSISVRRFIDHECNQYAKKYDFVECCDFSEGLVAIKRHGASNSPEKKRWMFFDRRFEPAFDGKYDEILKDFQKGVALVRIGDEKFYIDKKGKKVFGHSEE
jgi:hypothetical protein